MIELWNADELVKRAGETVAKRVDGLAIRRCPCCYALFVDPAPNAAALVRCYGPNYFTDKTNRAHSGSVPYAHYSFVGPNKSYEISDSEIATGNIPGHAEIVSSFDLRGKAILEIGCATGALLQSLKQYVPSRLVGIDIAREQIEFGKRHYRDVELHCGTLESAGFSAGEFDLVLMLDILEHVLDPSALFARASRLLNEGGSIFLRTPNADAFETAGSHWSYLFWGLEHVAYVRAATLNWLCERDGMSLRKTWSQGCPGAIPYPHWSDIRLIRMLRHPQIALSNRFYESSARRFEAQGEGRDLFALVARPRLYCD